MQSVASARLRSQQIRLKTTADLFWNRWLQRHRNQPESALLSI
ncbi:hypothetical protein COO91_04724 [Nostoc flagelliforme CCNUN1]|uniref:Uncharacterized protein n=1 Tax=Nostoc flagelliforme CCNUN1 TaxID=2038116 RepID=A0A2K8STG2_9NOSO|nr:hypothetical protein COO91_04724 [Nostoc flagelliforme CCNUN1]